MASDGGAQTIEDDVSAPDGFAGHIGRVDALENTYLRRRRLMDGADKTYLAYVLHVAEDLEAAIAPEEREAFLDHALARLADLKRITLNASAILALRLGEWGMVKRLAGEVVARDHHDLMAQRLIDAAGEEARDLVTETDRWLQSRRCDAPFRQMETRVNGTVHFCCSAWQPVPIGRFDTKEGGAGFWNSDTARELRRSVSEGDFTHCSRWHCPAIADRRLPEAQPNTAARPVTVHQGPKRVILSHDRSCNIFCPSCRTSRILMDHKASSRLDDVFRKSLLPLLQDAEDIKVTGSGDPFGSRHFRSVLKYLCHEQATRRIQLHTNGLLVNERTWDDLNLWENVSSVWVSVDAAEAETYAQLRRGGDFEQLIAVLRFLGHLRRSEAIDSLRLDFVVQQSNFEQMGDFVDLAQRVGANGVYFLRLRNWGHFSPEEFRELDVCNPDHPDHPVLLARLRDPRLDQSNVDLGSMATLRRSAGPSGYYD